MLSIKYCPNAIKKALQNVFFARLSYFTLKQNSQFTIYNYQLSLLKLESIVRPY